MLKLSSMVRIGIAIILLQSAIMAFFWRSLPPEVPFFYSRPWGKEQLAGPASLFLIPLLSLIILFVNLLTAGFAGKKEGSFPVQILVSGAVFFAFLGLIGLIRIIRLVV